MRELGVLLHPTALPGSPVCGGFGAAAQRWLEALARHGIRVWQVLPLAPLTAPALPTARRRASRSTPGSSMPMRWWRRASWRSRV
ncbi:4-alpha-glucanotransferase [Synechococcus sp. WH 8101]|nr:4-alpha-glucanotransferase [Synechococcus sp. WH 8101]